MKLTLNNVIERINQVLNYPSLAYEDVSHFFDHAIAELNTILKIAIPSVSEMVVKNTLDITLQPNTVLILTQPTAFDIPTTPVVPTEKPSENNPNYVYYANDRDPLDYGFYVWQSNGWQRYASLYGVCFENLKKTAYVAVPIGRNATWEISEANRTLEFDLCEYMTFDWWTLFVIPYVCFKYAVRDGDDGALYSTEFTQGLQQLQTSYDVPNKVALYTVAELSAYRDEVENNLNDLNKFTVTKAITDKMRVGNAISGVFGGLFDTGGWGI